MIPTSVNDVYVCVVCECELYGRPVVSKYHNYAYVWWIELKLE